MMTNKKKERLDIDKAIEKSLQESRKNYDSMPYFDLDTDKWIPEETEDLELLVGKWLIEQLDEKIIKELSEIPKIRELIEKVKSKKMETRENYEWNGTVEEIKKKINIKIGSLKEIKIGEIIITGSQSVEINL
jgi:hypothetical protein